MQQAPVTKPHEQDDDNDQIDLMGLLGTLIDHKWLIASVTGVFMAAGVAYALLATPLSAALLTLAQAPQPCDVARAISQQLRRMRTRVLQRHRATG